MLKRFSYKTSLVVTVATSLMLVGVQSETMAESGSVRLPADSLTVNQRLSLDALEYWVKKRNPDIEAARQAVTAAGAVEGQAGKIPDPKLAGVIAPRSIGREHGRVGYGLSLRQALPLAKLGSRSSSAAHWTSAAHADAQSTIDELIRVTRHAYVDFAVATQSVVINGELIDLVEQVRRVALVRYSTGLVGEVDPLQAEAELANLEHMALIFERERAIAIARLNSLLRRAWNDSLPEPPQLPAPGREFALDSLVTAATIRRPEVTAANARILARQAEVTLASREYIPDLELAVAYGTFMNDRAFWPRVGLAINVPLPFGRISSGKEGAEAELAMEQAKKVSEQDRIAFEVQEAYLRMNESAHQLSQFNDSWIPISERALLAARAGYESGGNDMLALLSAERQLANVSLGEIDALANYHRARSDLERAVGLPLNSVAAVPQGGSR